MRKISEIIKDDYDLQSPILWLFALAFIGGTIAATYKILDDKLSYHTTTTSAQINNIGYVIRSQHANKSPLGLGFFGHIEKDHYWIFKDSVDANNPPISVDSGLVDYITDEGSDGTPNLWGTIKDYTFKEEELRLKKIREYFNN